MQRYSNLGGDSSVLGYEIAPDSISVEFRDHSVYLYNYSVTGQANVDQMKGLAVGGRGLNSFISRRIRKAYAAKLR
jgi:hypothetical protein